MSLFIQPSLIAVVTLIAITVIILLIIAVKRKWMHWERISPFNLVMPYKGSPLYLMIYRIVIALYSFGVWGSVVFVKADAFSFYTIWNYTMFTIYFWISAIASFLAFRKGFKVSRTGFDPIPHCHHHHFFRTVYVFMEICSTMVILVDITLWGVLLPMAYNSGSSKKEIDEKFFSFSSFNVHLSNFFLIMIDFAFNRIHHIPAHSLFLLPWALAFGWVSWIYKSEGGEWVYPFLDTTDPYAWAWYIGLTGAHILFFFCVFGLSKLKEKCYRTKDGQDDPYLQYIQNDDDEDMRVQQSLLKQHDQII